MHLVYKNNAHVFAGGHLGRDKTWQKIYRYYWPGMVDDVVRMLKSCDKCQRVNPVNTALKAPLQPIPVTVAEAWNMVKYNSI